MVPSTEVLPRLGNVSLAVFGRRRKAHESSVPGFAGRSSWCFALVNRPVRTRMPGGVGRAGETPALTRLGRIRDEAGTMPLPRLEFHHCFEAGTNEALRQLQIVASLKIEPILRGLTERPPKQQR